MTAVFVVHLCFLFTILPVVFAHAGEPSPGPGAPPPAAPAEPPTLAPKPEEEPPVAVEPAPPPVALPGAPEPEDILDFQAPKLTAPPDAPGLVDRFQRALDLVQPGQLLFDLTVEGVYESNAFNTSSGPRDDFAVMIVPGVAMEQRAKNASLSLRYSPRILRYIEFSELDHVNHTLRFAGNWDPTPGVRLFLVNSLLITERRAEEASPLGISAPGTLRTTRNAVTPGAEFRLGPQDDLGLAYTNTFVEQEAGENTMVHGGSIGWRHRLPRWGIGLDYTPAYVDRESSGNAFNHAGTLRTTYRVSPRGELLFTVTGSYVDEEEGEDSAFAGGEVGINHQFTPNLRARVTGGAQVFGLAEGDPKPRFSSDSSLAWTFPRGSLTLGFVQRFENTFTTVDDVGTVLHTRGLGAFSYVVTPRLRFSVRGSYGRVEFEEQDRTDLVGRAAVDIRYQLWQSLFLTAGYTFFDRNSDTDANDLTDHRVFIGLSFALSTPI